MPHSLVGPCGHAIAPMTRLAPATEVSVAGASRSSKNENSVATSGSPNTQMQARAMPQRRESSGASMGTQPLAAPDGEGESGFPHDSLAARALRFGGPDARVTAIWR
jgi:hypothetical protein